MNLMKEKILVFLVADIKKRDDDDGNNDDDKSLYNEWKEVIQALNREESSSCKSRNKASH